MTAPGAAAPAGVDVEPSARVHHLPAALLAAAGAVLLAFLPEGLGERGTLIAVLVLQAALVLVWAPTTGIRGSSGVIAIGIAAAAAADLVLVLPERPELGHLLPVPGVAFVVAVAHQMVRRSPRRDVVGSLAGELLLVCGVCALAVLLRLPDAVGGRHPAATAALVVGATLTTGHLVDAVLPRPAVAPGIDSGVLGLVVSLLVGAGVAVARHGNGTADETLSAVTVGLCLAAVAALIGLAAGYVVAEAPDGPGGSAGLARIGSGAVLQAVLPFAACAPVAFSLVLHTSF